MKALAIALAALVSAFGVAVLLSGYAPERMTRFGLASALTGGDARQFGSSVILMGVMPLMLLAKTPRGAALFGSLVAAALVINVFFGAPLWA